MIGYFQKHGYFNQILTFLKSLHNRNLTNSRLISARASKHDCQTMLLSRVYFWLQKYTTDALQCSNSDVTFFCNLYIKITWLI